MQKRFTPAGMTLVEVLMSLGVIGVMTTLALVFFTQTQKQFTLTTTWTEARASQLRLIQAMEIDLRNSAASGTSSAVSGDTVSINGSTLNTLPVKMYVPLRYSSYYTSGAFAGEPVRTTSAPATGLTTGTGGKGVKVSYSGTTMMTITYSATSSGGVQTVYRNASWIESGGSASASRAIASFPTTMQVTFKNLTGTTGTLLLSSTTRAIEMSISPPSTAAITGKGDVITAMTKTIYLRNRATSK